MAGYYDDFMAAVALPDDLNVPSVDYASSKSHQGNAITGYAPLNPRHIYAWCERGDGATGQFNNAVVASDERYKTNNGVHEWLSYDKNRRNAGTYDGTSQLQFIDSLTNANRQKYNAGDDYASGDAVEGYLMFSHGYDTSARYFAAIGTTDATYGRDVVASPNANGGGASPILNPTAGLPATASTPTKSIRTHLAGVYAGEVMYNDNILSTTPKAILHPIESPAGGNFLVTEVYTTSTSYDPVLAFDGTLNSKGDGDIFTIRIHAAAVDTSSARFKLRIGCEGTAMTSALSGETGYSNAAIEYVITPVAYQEATSWSPPTLTSLWDDYDFVINYTANTYDVYKNGVSVSTGTSMNALTAGGNFTASDMYGWAVDAKDCSKKATMLVDRVGLIRPLTEHPSGVQMPPATDFNWNSSVNSISTLNLTLIDDDATLKLMSFFNQSSYADWSLLMFRDDISRPIWRGTVNSLKYSQTASAIKPTINITASDYFQNLNRQIPTWELGEGGDAGSTSTVAFNRSEAQNNLNTYFFGASRLVSSNASLSFNEVDDGANTWSVHKDSRMRNRSAHPIQMYLGEDTRGPNDAYDDWDTAITAGDATSAVAYRSVHSRWIKDMKESLWFRHAFGRISSAPQMTTTLSADFSRGAASMSISAPLKTTSGFSIEIIDSDGLVDSGVATSATTASSFSIVKAAWAYRRDNPVTNQNRHRFRPVIYIAQASITYATAHRSQIFIEGCSFGDFNGTWELIIATAETVNGTLCYKCNLAYADTGIYAYQYESFTGASQYSPVIGSVPPEVTATVWQNTNWIPNSFIVTSTITGGTGYMGTGVLSTPTTNFFERDHATGATVNIRTIDDDYKHIWVLWADMRNDGEADADNQLRKSSFGLMTPYTSNYSVSLVYADENTTSQDVRQEFVDLSIGDEVDLWEMDARSEPITGQPWAALTNASNSESNSKYHNWERKAGSFVIIDTSKFFNLNTYTNGGKTGQIAGGRKEIGDYLVETEGFPVLIDNYWVRSPATPVNLIPAATTTWNDNYKYILSQVAQLQNEVRKNDMLIQLTSSVIPDSVFPAAFQITSQANNKVWHGQAKSKFANVTSVPAAPDGAGRVQLAVTTTDARFFNREGLTITISGSTTTPTIDGTYSIESVVLGTGTNVATQIFIEIDPSVTITSGTVTLGADHTYLLDSLLFLGKPVAETKIAGDWDGTGYGGNNSAAYLVSLPTQDISDVDLLTNTEGANSRGYSDLQVYWGLANVFPTRLMMQLNGFVENPSSLTYAESDKFRTTWIDSLTRNWLIQTSLYGIPNFASIPISKNATTSQKPINTIGRSGYLYSTSATVGSTVTCTNFSGIPSSASPHGLINGDTITIIENAQLSAGADDIYRTDYTVSNITPTTFDITASGKTSTSLDGYWRKAGEVDTYGSVNDVRSSSISNIFSTTEAGAGVSNQYSTRSTFSWLMGRDSKPQFRPTYGSGFVFNRNNLVVSTLSSESNAQISNVRVYYGGGISFVDYPEASLGTAPRWEIVRSNGIQSSAEALKVAKQEYEKNKQAVLSIGAEIQRISGNDTMDGLNDTMLYNARYGYIVDQSRTIPRTSTSAGVYTDNKAWGWSSFWGGNLFGGATNALDGRDGGTTYDTDALTWDENYFWYGSHSLSNAVQIVHMPNGMPKTTDKTATGSNINADGKLRVVIDIDEHAEFTSVDNARFGVYLVDYEWGNNSYEAFRIDHTKIVVDANGYYEIAIPSSYWAAQTGDERIVISVNYDYLKSLLLARCGTTNLNKNAHDWIITYTKGFNTNSIFPLGNRKFADGDYWGLRSEWYAPRLHVVDDVNFYPATTVEYTDSVLELTSEPMHIRSLTWSISGANRESLNLKLERDVSRAARGGFASYLIPKVNKKSGGGSNVGSDYGGPITLPDATGGGRSGNPNDGSWGGEGSWGDSFADAIEGAKFTPMTRPSRNFGTPDGLTTNVNSQFNIGANNINKNLTNQIKGMMEFNNDSVTGGKFGVLGQKKPSAPPRNNDGTFGLDMSPASGDAVADSEGMTFAGAADGTAPYSAFDVNVPVPPRVNSELIEITGRLTMGAASGSAILFVTVSCLEEGLSVLTEVEVSSTTLGNQVLFSEFVGGASINNNNLKVTIARQAGSGDDDAQYGSVTIHNLQIGFDTNSVSGDSQSGQLSY